MNIPAHARTAHKGLPQKRLEKIAAESFLMSPRTQSLLITYLAIKARGQLDKLTQLAWGQLDRQSDNFGLSWG